MIKQILPELFEVRSIKARKVFFAKSYAEAQLWLLANEN